MHTGSPSSGRQQAARQTEHLSNLGWKGKKTFEILKVTFKEISRLLSKGPILVWLISGVDISRPDLPTLEVEI